MVTPKCFLLRLCFLFLTNAIARKPAGDIPGEIPIKGFGIFQSTGKKSKQPIKKLNRANKQIFARARTREPPPPSPGSRHARGRTARARSPLVSASGGRGKGRCGYSLSLLSKTTPSSPVEFSFSPSFSLSASVGSAPPPPHPPESRSSGGYRSLLNGVSAPCGGGGAAVGKKCRFCKKNVFFKLFQKSNTFCLPVCFLITTSIEKFVPVET